MSKIKNTVYPLIKYLKEPYRIFGWIYGAFLTILYVDERKKFPAIQFSKRLISVKIKKGKGARLMINGKLIIEPWIGKFPSEISIGKQATLTIRDDFIIGDDVHIRLSPNANAIFGGKRHESGSGITARSVILVNESLQIGPDVIIAWDTFVTDNDWHQIGDTRQSIKTIIGEHVWLANGVKILKGSKIGANSIVACGSVVTGGDFPERSIIGGVPAKVVKSNIKDWHR